MDVVSGWSACFRVDQCNKYRIYSKLTPNLQPQTKTCPCPAAPRIGVV